MRFFLTLEAKISDAARFAGVWQQQTNADMPHVSSSQHKTQHYPVCRCTDQGGPAPNNCDNLKLTMKACKHFSKESDLLRSAFSSEAKHSHTLNVSRRRADSASTTLLASEQSQLTARNCSGPLVQQKSLLHPCCAVSSRFGTLIFCATSCSVESVANPLGSASSRCRGSFFANLNFGTLFSWSYRKGRGCKSIFRTLLGPDSMWAEFVQKSQPFFPASYRYTTWKNTRIRTQCEAGKNILYLKQPAMLWP